MEAQIVNNREYYKIAVVGCGQRSGRYVRLLLGDPENRIKLVGMADPDENV